MTEEQAAALRQGMREDIRRVMEEAPELAEAEVRLVAAWISQARTDAALLELWDRRQCAISVQDGEIRFRKHERSGASMTRAEHLAWAKERALAYLDEGAIAEAFASLASDFSTHPELADHPFMTVGYMMLAQGLLDSDTKMREWIEGWN